MSTQPASAPSEAEQLAHAFRHLLGLPKDRPEIVPAPPTRPLGAHLEDHEKQLSIVVPVRSDGHIRNEHFLLRRPDGPFSQFEHTLCGHVVSAVEALWTGFTPPGLAGTIRTAVNASALQVGLARFLRPRLDHLWSVSSALSLVQNLTFRRYEGRPCTSGFVCLDQYRDAYAPPRDSHWTFTSLDDSEVDNTFFDNVASYRYVDGLTKYYVVALSKAFAQKATVFGTVELTSHQSYPMVHCVRHDHDRMLPPPGLGFLLSANSNSEVDIVHPGYKQFLRWSKGMWRVVNIDLLDTVVRSACAPRIASAVVGAALSLSSLRFGTLLLIRDPRREVPTGDHTDTSPLARALRDQMRHQRLNDVVDRGQFVNLLSSDGMTIIDPEGNIEDTGYLVRDVDTHGHKSGGARSAAARSASMFGLVVKVSADGPVSPYRTGDLIYETC